MSNVGELFSTLLAVGEPVITGSYLFQLFLRALHIASAIILVGGLFYMRTVLAPAGVDACFADRRPVWARWVAAASLFLLVSGFVNYINLNDQIKAAGGKLPSPYHAMMGIKIILALVVMFLMAVLAGKTSLAEKLRANMRKWLTVAWLAALAIVVLGAVLRSFH